MARSQVSAAELIRAWQSSNTTTEVMEKTGLAYGSLMARIAKMRKGFLEQVGNDPLKEMERAQGRRKTDYAELAKLCLVHA